MRYFASTLAQTLLLRLGSVKNWIVLLLIPAVAAAAAWAFPAGETAAPVQVGVCLPPDGAPEMWALLEECSDELLTFVAADPETIDRNIAAGQWDCGILLAEDFTARVRALDTDGIITLRTGPGSTVYPLVREAVSACMARLTAPVIARDFLEQNGIAGAEMDPAEPDRVLVRLSTLGGGDLEPLALVRAGLDGALCWLVSAMLLARLLPGAADLGAWITSPGVRRMAALRPSLWLMTARACADGLLLALSGSAAMALLGKGLWGCLAAAGYVLFWTAASVLLARSPGIRGGLPALVSFAVVLSLLASSVLADPDLLLPGLDGVCRFLPVNLFLAACRGQGAALLGLTAGAALCFGLAAVKPRKE